MSNTIKPVLYRRKREAVTNYRKRLHLSMSESPRLVVRRTMRDIIVQIVKYNEQGDNILAMATSRELTKLGWKASRGNIPAAYLTGMLVAKRAQKNKITTAIVDCGLAPAIKGGRIFAAVSGAIDGGLIIPHDKEALPVKDRLNGKHIQTYIKQPHERQFSTYDKNVDIPTMIELVKKEIMK